MPTQALGTYDIASFSIRDRTKEITTVEFQVQDITDETLPDILTAQTAFRTALVGITNGVIARSRLGIQQVISNLVPTDNTAQRESKLQVFYRSTVTEQVWDLTIGTVDFAVLTFLPNAGDWVAMTAGQGATSQVTSFITAFENFVAAADGSGASVAVTGLRYVGRNS